MESSKRIDPRDVGVELPFTAEARARAPKHGGQGTSVMTRGRLAQTAAAAQVSTLSTRLSLHNT